MENNIDFLIEDNDDKNSVNDENNFNYEKLIEQLNNSTDNINFTKNYNLNSKLEYDNANTCFTEEINYTLNYNVKDLLLICDYYGFAKNIKMHKCKKEEIVRNLVFFESQLENQHIVYNRKLMWFYMSELKNDKFMKKFVIW